MKKVYGLLSIRIWKSISRHQLPGSGNGSIDDSGVPSNAIISEALDRQILEVTATQTHSRCVGQWAKNDESGRWIADNKHEDIWPWNNDSKKWGDQLLMQGAD